MRGLAVIGGVVCVTLLTWPVGLILSLVLALWLYMTRGWTT